MGTGPRKGLFRRLTEALFEEEAATAAGRPVRAPAAPTGPDVEDEPWEGATQAARAERQRRAHMDFERRLAETVEQRRPGTAGKMTLFNLDQIRSELGDRWPAMAERARAAAEQTLQRRLAPNDSYAPFDDDGFVILFGDLDDTQAAIKLASMAKELHDRLLGIFGSEQDRHWVRTFVVPAMLEAAVTPPRTVAEFEERLGDAAETDWRNPPSITQRHAAPAAPPDSVRGDPARASAARVRLSDKVEEAVLGRKPATAGKMQFLDLGQIREEFGERWAQLADKAGMIVEHVIQSRIGPADVMAPYDDDSYVILFAELDEAEARLSIQALAREVRERLHGELRTRAPPKVEAFIIPLPTERPPSGRGLDWVVFSAKDRLNVVPPRDKRVGDRDAASRAGEISVGFRPTLFSPKGMVSVHDTRVVRLEPSGRVSRGMAAYPANDPPVVFEIDRVALELATRDLARMVDRGGAGLVDVPLHAISLLAHSNFLLIDIVRALKPEARRLLVLDLIGADQGPMLARMPDAVRAVAPFCRAVSARVGPDPTGLDDLARVGVRIVGVDLDGVASEPAVVLAMVERLVAAAARHGQTVYVFGVADPRLPAPLRAARVGYLNGPAVAAERSQPLPLHAWSPPRMAPAR
jgi:GGDEF domain-containing protein